MFVTIYANAYLLRSFTYFSKLFCNTLCNLCVMEFVFRSNLILDADTSFCSDYKLPVVRIFPILKWLLQWCLLSIMP